MATVKCENCEKKVEREVVYGYPSPELVETAQDGQSVFGGCDPSEPIQWYCDDCWNPRLPFQTGDD